VKQEKTKRNFSIRLPEKVITLLDEIAANTGLNITRNNIVEQACEWFVRTYRANGNRSLTEADMRDLEAFLIEKLASGKTTPQDNASNVITPLSNSGIGSSTAKRPNSRQAG